MKKMNEVKLIQLILFSILTILSIVLILLDPGTRNYVAKNSHILVICVILWVTLILSFVFLYLDFHLFSIFHKNVTQLDHVAHADTISGIANRFSCDSLIEKYIGAPLPANMGCVMIDITNIIDINKKFGRQAGDDAIRRFSDTMHLVAAGQCFIGRNGGNKFIALFENCSAKQLTGFVDRLHAQLHQFNLQPDIPHIHCQYGVAFHSDADSEANDSITDLIASANRRIYAGKE
ncbi:MAG: diguanylate cyclase [Lachnospiraceae bacterium]|nr:diguanylate cyclase [Lachnospiraceae bacterium]